jgi:hypothetical protein
MRDANILNLVSDAVFVTTLDGTITSWSHGAEKLYGWTAAEAIGKDEYELLKPKFPIPYDQLVQLLLRQDHWEGEVARVGRAGKSIEVLSRWVLFRGSTGAPMARLVSSTDVTDTNSIFSELRIAEAEATARATELKAILDALPAATFIAHDRACREMTSSRAAYKMLRLEPGTNTSKSALVGQSPSFRLFSGGKELSADELPIQRAAASGQPVLNTELNIAFDDGSSLDVFGHAIPLSDEAGEVRGAVGSFVDITELKRVQRELRISESRFRRLWESDLMGIGIPDRFGGFRESNDEFLRIVGYTREDMEAGRVRWDTMTPKEYAELDQAHIEEAAQRGSCTPYEKEYIRKDGTRVPIFCGYALLEGSRDQYIGFVRDMSAEKRAETALREREQRYRILAESLPQFVWERDAEGKYIYCNQRLLDYVGSSIDWLDGEVYELVHPDDQKKTRERWHHSISTGEVYLNEYRLRRHDGTYRYFLTRASPIRDKDGQIERWLGCTIDIHDQKIAEEGVRRSEKLAAMGRLAATMAHEINNPLTAVTNSIYLALQDPSLTHETRHFLTIADQELARAVQVATQTLRFHKQSSAPARVNVTDIMDSVLALYGPRFRSASIVLEREYLDRGELYCFSDELRQVFANVISNSVDAMPRGGRLRVRARNGKSLNSAGALGIKVLVADTGDGIPQHLHRSIFEPFVTTKESTGTGLGLWVSEGIVKKHNGRIAMRSNVHPERHGTAVSMFFPFDGLQQ